MNRRLAWLAAAIVVTAWLALVALPFAAHAHWAGATTAGAPDKAWWDALAGGKGLCCSFADGQRVEDVDWDTATIAEAGGQSHIAYRVRLYGQWIVVPPEAVVTEPNKFGPAVVWPYQDAEGKTQIRCFLPGAGA
jgi:hypothetical protein